MQGGYLTTDKRLPTGCPAPRSTIKLQALFCYQTMGYRFGYKTMSCSRIHQAILESRAPPIHQMNNLPQDSPRKAVHICWVNETWLRSCDISMPKALSCCLNVDQPLAARW